MNLYSEHYWKIEKYKQNFEKILDYLEKTDNFEDKLNLAVFAADYFVYHNSGYYTSAVLEKFFVDYAKSIKVDLSDIEYKKGSFLHVLTNGYETGGHTRVVERWIENAPANQVHSVVQTITTKAKLATLKNNVKNKNGEFILLENKLSIEEKAIQLRKLAMKYEYVILHTHMEDPIAIVAFGTEDFIRPVLFYNHASHMPWLGKSIADLVLNIECNDLVTEEKRGIKKTYFLGVPSKEIIVTNTVNKQELRKKINFPIDKKIIVTCGRDAKYRSITGRNFLDYLKNIMDDNTYCYVIGVKPKNREWKNAIRSSGKKIILLGNLNFSNGFLNHLKAADLYLDSYPVSGGTATIDAISCGIPVLSLDSVHPQFDYLMRTSAYCKTETEFINKAKLVLSDKKYANELFEEVKKSLLEYQSINAWNKRLEKLYEIAPKQHKIQDLSGVIDYSEANDLSVFCNVMLDNKFINAKKINLISDSQLNKIIKYGSICKRQGIPFIFEIQTVEKNLEKIKTIKVFNIRIYPFKSTHKHQINSKQVI